MKRTTKKDADDPLGVAQPSEHEQARGRGRSQQRASNDMQTSLAGIGDLGLGKINVEKMASRPS